jgi:hypothetical protein
MRTLILILFAASLQAQSIAVLGSVQFTRDAVGVASGTDPQAQGSKPSFGGAIEYTRPMGNYAVEAVYSLAASDATFAPLFSSGVLKFGLTRNELASIALRRIGPLSIGFGSGIFVTNGKWAPGGRVGLDEQMEEIASVRYDRRVNARLSFRAELVSHFLRAPSFSDPLYRAGRTAIFEPRIGLVYRFKGKK